MKHWEMRLVVVATIVGASVGALASAVLQLLERMHVNLDRLDDVLVDRCPGCGQVDCPRRGLWSAMECDGDA